MFYLFPFLVKCIYFFVIYNYYVDTANPNSEFFLLPIKDKDMIWMIKEMTYYHGGIFNMKHSNAQNLIQRCHGLLKLHQRILKGANFHLVKTQNRNIVVRALSHNFIRRDIHLSIQVWIIWERKIVDLSAWWGYQIYDASNSSQTCRTNLATKNVECVVKYKSLAKISVDEYIVCWIFINACNVLYFGQ